MLVSTLTKSTVGSCEVVTKFCFSPKLIQHHVLKRLPFPHCTQHHLVINQVSTLFCSAGLFVSLYATTLLLKFFWLDES